MGVPGRALKNKGVKGVKTHERASMDALRLDQGGMMERNKGKGDAMTPPRQNMRVRRGGVVDVTKTVTSTSRNERNWPMAKRGSEHEPTDFDWLQPAHAEVPRSPKKAEQAPIAPASADRAPRDPTLAGSLYRTFASSG